MFILQMSGVPGSGKSTLARMIAKETGAVIIDHDIVKTAFLESWEGDIDPRAAGKVCYSIEWSLIDFHLSQGHNVILDSPCGYTVMLEKGSMLCRKYNVNYKYIECYVTDAEVLETRLRTRKRMISQMSQLMFDKADKQAYQDWLDKAKRPADTR